MTIDDWLSRPMDLAYLIHSAQLRFRRRLWAKKERAANRMKDRILLNVRRCHQRTRSLLDRVYLERMDRLARHEKMRQEWLKKLAEWQRYKDNCNLLVCPLCDGRKFRASDDLCEACHHEIVRGPKGNRKLIFAHWLVILRRMLHRNFNSHACGGGYRRARKANEWADALGGKSGPRGCGAMSWDNAVRAMEDG